MGSSKDFLGIIGIGDGSAVASKGPVGIGRVRVEAEGQDRPSVDEYVSGASR